MSFSGWCIRQWLTKGEWDIHVWWWCIGRKFDWSHVDTVPTEILWRIYVTMVWVIIGPQICERTRRVNGYWDHYIDVIMTTMASPITSLTFIQTQIKENIKAPRHWPLCGEFTGTGEFPAQKASNAENVSIWWRHHASKPTPGTRPEIFWSYLTAET